MRACRTVDPRNDAARALAMLGARGLRLVALTSSGAQAGQAALEACGLAGYVGRVLGVDGGSTFKPRPSVYA